MPVALFSRRAQTFAFLLEAPTVAVGPAQAPPGMRKAAMQAALTAPLAQLQAPRAPAPAQGRPAAAAASAAAPAQPTATHAAPATASAAAGGAAAGGAAPAPAGNGSGGGMSSNGARVPAKEAVQSQR